MCVEGQTHPDLLVESIWGGAWGKKKHRSKKKPSNYMQNQMGNGVDMTELGITRDESEYF